ncbi:MAG: DNA replication and repair protein RecF [Slackia sp.]|nr:DNA replication and repair protein RecF [Slackia sp.]
MLRLEGIQFRNFRSYESFSVDRLDGLTVLIGPNAVGKTNVVEGMQLVTAFGSFRNAPASELIRWGCPSASIVAHMVSSTRDLTVRADIGLKSRAYSLNGKKKAVHDLQGLLPSVAFSPDDLVLAKGAQSHRRAALDLLGCQLSRSHRIIRRDFERLVKHKNALLKDDAAPLLIESVNDMLVPSAAQLYLYRAALVANLSSRMARAYAALADGERIDVSYIPSWESDEAREAAQTAPRVFSYSKEEAQSALAEAFSSRAAEERARRRSVVGPHRDRVEFFIDGRNATTFASQGQQRSLVLSWKIAEVEIVREMLGVAPVLLLDDVMSELDVRRRHALMGLLENDMQTFITATDTSCFDGALLERARLLELEGGGVWAR